MTRAKVFFWCCCPVFCEKHRIFASRAAPVPARLPGLVFRSRRPSLYHVQRPAGAGAAGRSGCVSRGLVP